MFLLFLASKFK